MIGRNYARRSCETSEILTQLSPLAYFLELFKSFPIVYGSTLLVYLPAPVKKLSSLYPFSMALKNVSQGKVRMIIAYRQSLRQPLRQSTV